MLNEPSPSDVVWLTFTPPLLYKVIIAPPIVSSCLSGFVVNFHFRK